MSNDIVELSKNNNHKFNNNINTLSSENQIKYNEYNKFVEDSKKNLNLIVKSYNNLINVINYLIDKINKESDSISSKKKNIKNLSDVYKNLQETFNAFKDNKTNFKKLEDNYNIVKKSINDKKTELTLIIQQKNKNNNTFATSKFYEIKNLFTKIIKKVELIIINIKQDFENKNNQLNTLLADARYNLKEFVIDYFNSEINKISIPNELEIVNINKNSDIINKLYTMKKIQLQMKEYIEQLNTIVSSNSLPENYPKINNTQLIDQIKKINDNYNIIKNRIIELIKNFKDKTQTDIFDLQQKISVLIEQIKKLVSDFKLKHNIFNDNNFANITSQINSLTNATNSKKYMDKLDEILKNLTKGINDNNNNISYVNAVNSLSSNNFGYNNAFKSKNSIQSEFNPSIISNVSNKLGNRMINNNAKSELTQNNNINNNTNNLNLSTETKVVKPSNESNSLQNTKIISQQSNNKFKKMNNLMIQAKKKKNEINKNQSTYPRQKSIKIQKIRNNLASKLTLLANKNNGSRNKSLLKKRTELLENFNK